GDINPLSVRRILKTTVVICTRRRPVLLRQCLSAVAHLDPAPTQVIVVDNSPQGDGDTEKVAREFGARYTHEPKAGLSHARKRGLDECDTDAVAFLEDDAIPQPNWLLSSIREKSTV
ncbi:MAG: glycosyltransferase family A protein, partial [Terracidiphilus sp.]